MNSVDLLVRDRMGGSVTAPGGPRRGRLGAAHVASSQRVRDSHGIIPTAAQLPSASASSRRGRGRRPALYFGTKSNKWRLHGRTAVTRRRAALIIVFNCGGCWPVGQDMGCRTRDYEFAALSVCSGTFFQVLMAKAERERYTLDTRKISNGS